MVVMGCAVQCQTGRHQTGRLTPYCCVRGAGQQQMPRGNQRWMSSTADTKLAEPAQQTGRDRQDGTDRTGQTGQDGTDRTGQTGRDRQDRTDRTG